MSDDKENISELMHALGAVVVIWGMLEDAVRNFTSLVIFGLDVQPELERALLSEVKFREQLKILKKAAVVRHDDKDWCAKLIDLLAEVGGRLHDKRNRYIHDLWEHSEEGGFVKYIRGSAEASVTKTSGRLELRLAEGQEVMPAELDDFFSEVADRVDALIDLRANYVKWLLAQQSAEIVDGMKARFYDDASSRCR